MWRASKWGLPIQVKVAQAETGGRLSGMLCGIHPLIPRGKQGEPSLKESHTEAEMAPSSKLGGEDIFSFW